ncbi:tectonin beta-propeller repeat-containing protein 1 isoform X2 [Centruroides vittatus]|uniref:tectonin beta-propeller repeat-containing protein 1 isoform X2 n=1 Tax=Centruroides vittatus TaxID=120091 RepID=UPI00350EB86B
MPTTEIWAVNSLGRVFTLSTKEQFWKELRYGGLEFKRVSAVSFCTWAIGGDHMVYVHIPLQDIPIRFKEVTFENERWNPYSGFTSKLLPTDRPHFSSEDGLTELPKENFQLPSPSWQWEEDWYIEDSLDGQPLGIEGWTYSVDFPLHYGPSKKWNSMVRRRKWVRYRKFIAMDNWTLVPSIYSDPVTEPFLDVAVGGNDIPGGNTANFAVWSVTVMGRIMFRCGVSTICPEGAKWIHIPTPSGCEVNQISVSPTGLVWAVTWDGNALVRTGVNRENIIGNVWKKVDCPNEKHPLLQISVGTNTVWAVSRSGEIWFRKGIKGQQAGVDDDYAIGSGWVKMVGEMSSISVGPNDQVWGLGRDDKIIYFRTGITQSELSGKTWKPILLPLSNTLSKNNSFTSTSSQKSILSKRNSECEESSFSTPELTPKLSKHKTATKFSLSTSLPSTNVSTNQSTKLLTAVSASEEEYSQKIDSGISLTECIEDKNSLKSFSPKTVQNNSTSLTDFSETVDQSDVNMSSKEDSVQTETSLEENISAIESHSILLLENNDSDKYRYEAEFPREVWPSTMMDDSCSSMHVYETMYGSFSWIWISCSGCMVDPQALPQWFTSGSFSSNYGFDEPWRLNIVFQFQKRYENEIKKFKSYPLAVEKLVNNLVEVTCVVNVSDQKKQAIAIHTAERTAKRNPLKLSFRSDNEMEDWFSTLCNVSCDLWNLRGRPENTAIWSTTTKGDIYVSNCNTDLNHSSLYNVIWKLLGGGHLNIVETCKAGVVWGIGYNNTVWVYTGGYGGGIFKGISGCNLGIYSMTDVRHVYVYENQRWNPLSGFSQRRLPTDRYVWSDKTGHYECTKENTPLPSKHWQWISDWAIDYHTPGGVDNAGWQYATDFPYSYHSHKTFTDYVRRRRWFRKCKLNTTGPWQELGTTPLIDISFQVDHSGDPNEPIATWAVATNGDVLCRIGVTSSCPKGINWIHVPTDQSFKSISVGGSYKIWAIGKDGSAFLRNSVSSKNPTGSLWFHVEAPQHPLCQISVGKTSVFATDESKNLWYRQEIVPVFPEGTSWKLVCSNVRMVSVGPDDQVWAVLETIETEQGSISGVICQREGVTEANKIGTGWTLGIGGGWQYVSARGCASRNLDADAVSFEGTKSNRDNTVLG